MFSAIVIATLVLAGSASADPPKQDFYFRWGPADEALWLRAGRRKTSARCRPATPGTPSAASGRST